MSFKGVFEFILHLHDFKNIDLPNQGLASISASIYKQQKNGKNIYAIPYQFPFQRTYKVNKKKVHQQAGINDTFFVSKVVVVKYADQIIKMDDFVQFRMQLQGFPSLNTDNIYLQLNLIFSNRYYSSKDDKFDGKPVSQVKLRLKQIQNGIICYSQADFKNEYFSKLSFTLFGQLMYYKFQKYHIKSKQPNNKQISRSKVDNITSLLIWTKQYILSQNQNVFDLFYLNYVKNLRHSNYMIQIKQNNYLIIKKKIQIKLPEKFMKINGLQIGYEVDQKLFRKYLQTYKINNSAEEILGEIQQIRIENFQFFNFVIQNFYNDEFNYQKMKEDYQNYIKQKYGQRVFKNTLYQFQPNVDNALKQNKRIAKQMRNKDYSLAEHPIENQIFISKKDQHEFIFYQVTLPQTMKNKQENNNIVKKQQKVYESKNQAINSSFITSSQNNQNEKIQLNSMDQNASQSSQKQQSNKNEDFFTQSQIKFQKLKYTQKNMLIVMCHGFQGSSYDMTCLNKAIKSCLPEACYLLSRKNEDDTQGNIQLMGQRLADQIKYYIRAYMNQQTVIINFVGHSMGGIISRASLKHLLKFKDQFGFFCSLSSPHLGYLNGVDNKIKAGLWVLRKWKPIKSLDQLAMEDNKKLRETFLYKLSKQGSLKYFRKIIFFSSFEDSYVSWHSARVSAHNNKNSQSKIQQQMVNNILGLAHGVNKQTTIHRLDINFNVKGNNIDSLIGRAAHINLIIQETFFDVINTCIPQLFSLKEYGTGLEK